MVSTEEALKHMEERAKKRKKVKPSSTPTATPLSSPSRHGEKRKELETSSRLVK